MKKRGSHNLSSSERANARKIRLLQRQVRQLQKRQKYGFLRLLIKIVLVTLPLWAVLFLSFETDISVSLTLTGIILFFLIYFGTLGLYFYFRYRRIQ